MMGLALHHVLFSCCFTKPEFRGTNLTEATAESHLLDVHHGGGGGPAQGLKKTTAKMVTQAGGAKSDRKKKERWKM